MQFGMRFINRIIYGLPLIAIFGPWVGRFGSDFHGWCTSELKSLANRLTGDSLFNSRTLFCISHAISRLKRHRLFISPFIVTRYCDVIRRRGTGIVTSSSPIVPAHAKWHKVDIHTGEYHWCVPASCHLRPLLLIWINFNPSMHK